MRVFKAALLAGAGWLVLTTQGSHRSQRKRSSAPSPNGKQVSSAADGPFLSMLEQPRLTVPTPIDNRLTSAVSDEAAKPDGRISNAKWGAISALAGLISAVASALALYTAFRSLEETQRQADIARQALIASFDAVREARRQADIAEQALVASTRARLKLASVTGISARRLSGVIPGVRVVWFDVSVAYKNFGQTPAQNISFVFHVFVLGAGPSPTKTCENGKLHRSSSLSKVVVFPQDQVDGGRISFQVPMHELEAQAAHVIAVNSLHRPYLGVVGCLSYKSAGSDSIYVTGFAGDIYRPDAGGSEKLMLYDTLIQGSAPIHVKTEIRVSSAWAD